MGRILPSFCREIGSGEVAAAGSPVDLVIVLAEHSDGVPAHRFQWGKAHVRCCLLKQTGWSFLWQPPWKELYLLCAAAS